jgi:aquaporin NIP
MTAEFLATMILVIGGCGAIMVDADAGALGPLGISLSFGVVVMVMVGAVGHVSGAHLNPAVTLAFAVTRHFPWRQVLPYVAAQAGGAITGAVILRFLLSPKAQFGATTPAGGWQQAFAAEILLTAILVFVIMAVATDSRAVGELAAVSIGATVGLNALWGGSVSGASMNPARSLGPALVFDVWQSHWLYWLGPILGGLIGAAAYQFIRGSECQNS